VQHIEVTADGAVCLAFLGHFSPHNYEIVLRDTRTGARLGTTPPADWQPLALAPVGTRIAGRLNESRLAVWDWASGHVQTLPEFDPQLVAWHPDGQTLVAASGNGAVMSWHPGSGRGNRQPVPSAAPLLGVAVAAGGQAAALSENGD